MSLLSHVPYVQFTIYAHSAMLHRGVATTHEHDTCTANTNKTKQNMHAACGLRSGPPARPPAPDHASCARARFLPPTHPSRPLLSRPLCSRARRSRCCRAGRR